MRIIIAALLWMGLSFSARSQNFEPAPSSAQQKLENAMNRYGNIKRIYLSDTAKKTFETRAGNEYFIWFTYKTKNKSVRRMMVVEQGPNGEKAKIHYIKTSEAITDGDTQAFLVSFVAPSDKSPTPVYKVDSNKDATVYIYHLSRGNQ